MQPVKVADRVAAARADLALDPAVTGHMAGELSVLAVANNYRNWLWERTAPHLGQRVLEVGSGLGFMTDCLGERELVIGMELVPEYVQALRRKVAGRRIEIVEGDARDRSVFDPIRGRVDSAMSFNVLEHIDDDRAVLENVQETLPSGGRFVCFVPAFPSIYGAMDAKLGHVRRYRRREFINRAREAGFLVRVADYMNLPGYFAWFINGRILRSDGAVGGTRVLSIYDRTVVRAARGLERKVRPPFGQSLLAVLEKR